MFGSNKESKKMQKTILKQNYENFAASSQEDNSSSIDETINTAHSLSAASSKDQAFTASYADDVMRGYFAKKCKSPRNQGNRNIDAPTRNAPVDTSTTNALVVQDEIGSLSSSSSDSEKLGDGFEFKKKACFVCGGINHLIKDYDFYENKMVLNNKGKITGPKEVRSVWDITAMVNHQNKLTHPHPKRNFVPAAVLKKSRQVPVNAAKQSSYRAATSVSTARHDQGIFNDGCSRHMTGNKSYLIDYQEINGRFVAFGGNVKGGIENQMDHKVKTIRGDNGTKFKNRIMNEFCEMNGPKSLEDEVADDAGKKSTEVPRMEYGVQDLTKEGDNNDQEKDLRDQEEALRNNDATGNNTYMLLTHVSVAGSSYVILGGSIPVNAVTLLNADLPTDHLMPNLEDTADPQDTRIFSGAYDDEVEGVVANFNNLELTTVVSPIPTTRIHKDHLKEQIIGDPLSAPQPRRMTKIS
nr:hypothetical protein [Tanacetum cinerariifolium]